MGLLLYSTECGLAKKYSLRKVILIFLSVSILLFLKIYILIALSPPLIANFWIRKSPDKFIFLKYCFVFVTCGLLLIFVSALKPQYNVIKLISNKQQKTVATAKGGVFLLSENYFVRIDYNRKDDLLIPVKENYFRIKMNSNYDAWRINDLKDTLQIKNSTDTSLYKLMYNISPANTVISPLKLKPTFVSLLKNAPLALFNTLTTPLNFLTNDWLKIFASLENLFYLISFVIGAICFKFPKENRAILYFCFSVFAFVFILAGLTTPIVGALVRYKTPALPFMMIFVFMMVDSTKWKRIPLLGKLID
jgi:hypothetical protein